MKMLMRGLRIIDIPKRMMIISLSENIDRSFMIIKIKMTIRENLIKTITKERATMIIKVMNKVSVKLMFINRDTKQEVEDIKKDTDEAEAMKEEGIREGDSNREAAEKEIIIEEREGTKEKPGPISMIPDLGTQIKTHSTINMNRINIVVKLTISKISINILWNRKI
jgi:hypothetical protein